MSFFTCYQERKTLLESRASEIFKLVARTAPAEQWADWLGVPLEHAAEDGNTDLVNITCYQERESLLESRASEIFKLVAQNAPSEQWAEWLGVPLEHAAEDGNIDLVNSLIGAGAKVGAKYRGCHGRTLLDSAAVGGNAEVVSALLDAGAPPDVPGSSERSALYIAAWLRHEDAGRRLIAAGANVNSLDPEDDIDVLGEAVLGRCENMVNDLLEAGANPNTSSGMPERTPLHLAAMQGSKRMVSALLASGADKDAVDGFGKSPLILAVENCGSRHLPCFGAGAKSAEEADYPAVANSLLAAGADVEIRADSDEQNAALDTAAAYGHIGILKAILRHGADVDAVDEWRGRAALHVAAENGRVDAIEALIEAGADIELEDLDGRTPMGSATTYALHKAMRALLQRGSNTAVQDNQGNTLFHMACHEQGPGLDAAVDVLLRSGVDETAVNNDGRSPLELMELPAPMSGGGCSPEGRERARLLLARAPADRTWRRRGWVVMLSSHASKARAASCSMIGGCERGTDAAGSRQDGQHPKITRVEQTGEGGSSLRGQSGNGEVFGAGNEDGGLRAVVESLIGLGVEGVFRTVVGFL